MTKEPLKVAVIGAGIWSGQHAYVFSTLPQTELVAVCDIDSACAETMAKSHGPRQLFTDQKAILALDEVEAVSIATPDFTHTPLILDAMGADKHVLSEKPVATTTAEAAAIILAAIEESVRTGLPVGVEG